ncbi:hypothetical protein [Thalassotalea sediminis]|uniref:hypothetical protein n=1 Tax=Thalassotalea sediminis TaxID=1759089 RepID=UPI002572537B|nr:hypothetical protein [Thalassotalea sediminis]
MKQLNNQKHYIIGPIIALLALLCGAASAETNTVMDEIKQIAANELKTSMKKNQHYFQHQTKQFEVKPIKVSNK